MGARNLSGVAGCPLFRTYLSIEVNGRAVSGTFGIVRYIVQRVSAVEGCPALEGCTLSGVRYFSHVFSEATKFMICGSFVNL